MATTLFQIPNGQQPRFVRGKKTPLHRNFQNELDLFANLEVVFSPAAETASILTVIDVEPPRVETAPSADVEPNPPADPMPFQRLPELEPVNRPAIGSPQRNHVIQPNDVLAPHGEVTRIRANLTAIKLLKELEAADRLPSAKEKLFLAQYVGWGGLSQIFDDIKAADHDRGKHLELRRLAKEAYYCTADTLQSYLDQAAELENWHKKWGKYRAELAALLTDDEWQSAAASTISAYYTGKEIVSAMWEMVQRLGFKGGTVLEPAAGVGHFIGLMPEDLADVSVVKMVELDRLSGRITRKLYPEADVQICGFQDAQISDNSVDLAISNVPFGDIAIFDPTMTALKAPKLSLHNYCFAKALQKVKPGGLIAFVTTGNTLDAGFKQRRWLSERADLVAAIRLPNTAFKESANTEVTADIVFLRKPNGTPFAKESFVSLAKTATHDGKPMEINEYFTRHPEMILGLLANDGHLHRAVEQMTVHPLADCSLAQSLNNAMSNLPRDVVSLGAAMREQERRRADIFDFTRGMKHGVLTEMDDGSLVMAGSAAQTEDILKPKYRPLARDFMRLRDTLNELYRLELNPGSGDAELERQRHTLNQLYDYFIGRHGNLHQHGNLLGVDPNYYRLLGTEVEQKATAPQDAREVFRRKKIYAKGAVYQRRVLTPRVEPTAADSLNDALGISLGWRGKLDVDFIAALLRCEREQVERQLLDSEQAYRNPATGLLEVADEYLAGNVRHKLEIAQAHAADGHHDFAKNITALQKVQPAPVKFADIQFYLGSAWIPAEFVTEFARQILNSEQITVIYHHAVGEMSGDSWEVRYGNAGSGVESGLNAAMCQTYGTSRLSALALLEKSLNLQQPEVYDQDPHDKNRRVFNATATTQAKVKQEKLKNDFIEWVQRNPDTQARLVEIYNHTFNSHVLRQYNGQFLQFPWLASGFELYPDKKNVVWRALQDGRLLVAHGVGGGKTIIGTAIAMEMRRLGLARKPLIVVHNATLEQFAATICAMAPTANVLVARKKDLEGAKRKEFLAKVAAGDWDAVVMAHSSFNMIPDDPAWEQKLLGELIAELKEAISDAGSTPGTHPRKEKSPSVKEMQKSLARLEERVEELLCRKKDNVLNFQELGIDLLILDEAHLYKKIPFITKLHRIAGIDNGTSERGTGLLTKVRYLQDRNKGRNVITMTGTPVTNTLGESWNMVRLVAPDVLDEFKVRSFDRFVSTFASIVSSAELRANGAYKQIDRLAALNNLPEWNKFFRLAVDVKMGGDMQVRGRPNVSGGKPELVAIERTPAVAKFTAYIKKIIDWFDKLDRKEKKENSHIPLLTYNAAKLAAVDIRMVCPEAPDEAGSKANVCLRNVIEIYRRTSHYKGTQVIFIDNFHPIHNGSLMVTGGQFFKEMAEQEQLNDSKVELSADGFNLYADMKRKLIAAGIPAAEIAIINDYPTDDKKQRLFDQINEGEVRVTIGSTQRLGTGVNMQRRLYKIHHLDIPWTPAELEQRDGRGHRQGNLHADMGVDIEITRYGMKDTLDAALWQKQETKARFIIQAISGKINARSIEDDTGLLNLAEQKAVLSGPLGMRKFEIDQKVRELAAEERAWRSSLADAANIARNARHYITELQTELNTLMLKHETVKNWTDRPVMIIGAESTQDYDRAAALLKEWFDTRKQLIATIGNPITSARARAPLGQFLYEGVSIELGAPELTERLGETNPLEKYRLEVPLLVSGQPIEKAASAGWVLNHLKHYPRNVQTSLARCQSQITKYTEHENTALADLEKPFAKAAELTAARQEQTEILKLVSHQPAEDAGETEEAVMLEA